MKTRIQKWGNSLALRIPKTLADEAGFREDAEVEIALVDGQLVIKHNTPTYDLDTLLAQISNENIHGEIDTGASLGNEAW